VDTLRIQALSWIFNFFFGYRMVALAFVLYDWSLKVHGVASGAFLGWGNCICILVEWPVKRVLGVMSIYSCNENNALP
jgi:hypothetical protein